MLDAIWFTSEGFWARVDPLGLTSGERWPIGSKVGFISGEFSWIFVG
jgi:hypothetical protein